MELTIKERDGVWNTKHINPKNEKKLREKYATREKVKKGKAPSQPIISPPPNTQSYRCMYPDGYCYDCPNREECYNGKDNQ